MAIALNLLIIGKIGVGKSSLVNYISENNIAKVVAGKTKQSKVLQKYDIDYKGSKIGVFDTKAINMEEDIETEILASFNENKKRADFDLIVYCISSLQESIKTKEVERIVEIRKKNKNMIFVITADDIKRVKNKNVLSKLKDLGFKDSDFVRISSEQKEYLSGKVGEQYGKTKLFESIKVKLREHIARNIINEFAIVIERKVPMWSLRCKSELKNNKSLFVRKNEKRTEEELVKDFNLYLKETEGALNEELSSILKSIYRKYRFMYNEEVLEYCEEMNISSQLYLPDKLKKTYNFAILDKIEKNLVRHWSDAMKEVIRKFGV
ncbi:MAG: GTPase domain-containing protein [Sarcina sp.]